MAAPKRRAPLRTAAALSEDLAQARRVGGLARATEQDLAATLDLMALQGMSEEQLPLTRARALLSTYVGRGCKKYGRSYSDDLTAAAAAESLEILLNRTASDTTLAVVVRRQAVQHARHSVSTDAVRHREDRIIGDIAAAVFSDLINWDSAEPKSVEAALHAMMPLVSEIRDKLHAGMMLTYPKRMPPNPREASAQNVFLGQMMVKCGWLLEASRQLALRGRGGPLDEVDYFFVQQARLFIGILFDEEDDREDILAFLLERRHVDWDDLVAELMSTDSGRDMCRRWVRWAGSCYTACAFERTTDLTLMCTPHQLLTELRETELRYDELRAGGTGADVAMPRLQKLRRDLEITGR